MYYSGEYISPVGRILLKADDKALLKLAFTDEEATINENNVIVQTQNWLAQYFSGRFPDFTPPIELEGTPFQHEIWELLREIPVGKTVTYKQITQRYLERTGRNAMSAQAVGGAVGKNPVAVIIPCHRVIGSDGSLTGYEYGLDIKEYLIRLEEKML